MEYVFVPPIRPSLPVVGSENRFPVRRVYCVGRNYAEHAREMGDGPSAEPCFFTKPADAVFVPEAPEGVVPYPLATHLLHHEVELVVALDRGGTNLDASTAAERIFGYAVGVDLTRRDLQRAAREKGLPWDMSKGFTSAGPCTPIRPAGQCFQKGFGGALTLRVNGEERQNGRLEDMILDVPELIAALSRMDRLAAGDLIFTGTPAGVGELRVGDHVQAAIEGVGELDFHIAA
ncbi:MAG TPA: fumarylacetoacetate hydrolase family protein [Gammaproteobacteria bacterium]|nr:fumarylacetoacetate hydrolase family protein [Gammaproteobacteria bacterium]